MLNLKSIRLSLPLSYAAIALLTAVSLGSLLMFTLRGHYARMEFAYLQENARVIGDIIADLFSDGIEANAIETHLNYFALLSQARVRFLNLDGRITADTGAFQPGDTIRMQWIDQRSDVFLSLPAQQGEEAVIHLESSTPVERWDIAIPAQCPPVEERTALSGCMITSPVGQMPIPVIGEYAVSIAPTLYGYELNRNDRVTNTRSDQVVEQSVYDRQGVLVGYIMLSDSPAYGSEIVNSVVQASIMASTAAVALAAGAGWLVSRTITVPVISLTEITTRMALGDLSARTTITRTDEIGTLARAYNDMAGQIEETVLTLRRFVADAAHELNTPLTALRTNLEIADAEEMSAKSRVMLERAQTQVKRLEMLTKGLLQLSRIESGTLDEKRTSLEISEMMHEIADAYASQAEQARIELNLVLPDEPLHMEVDETLLRCALGNLVENAIKFTPEQGKIYLEMKICEHDVELWIKDTGIGIPAEDIPYLFNRFYRGRNAARYPGSGLGLAIVKAIVERCGASVKVYKQPVGTAFVLSFYVADQRP